MNKSKSPEVCTQSVDGFGIWKLECDTSRGRWLVKVKRKGKRWHPIDFFPTPEECALFVGGRSTGERDWDEFPHQAADFLLPKWDRTNVD